MSWIEDWNRAATADEDGARDFLTRVEQAGARYGDRPLCTARRPLALSGSTASRFRRILRDFHQAVAIVRRMLLDDGLREHPDSLVRRMGISPEALELARHDPGGDTDAVLTRVDTYLVDGHPWILELNAESPAGLGYADALTDVFLADSLRVTAPQLQPMRVVQPALRGLLDAYRRRTHGAVERGPDMPRVAIVDFDDVPTAPEFHLLARGLKSLGCQAVVRDPRDLACEGGRLVDAQGPIDLVYRRLLVADALERPAECAALLAAYRAGAVVVINSFRSALLHGKGLFAMFHDPWIQELLPPRIARTLRRHVPWTGILAERPGLGAPPDLRDRARAHREGWVIKPLEGHGGHGVVLGWQQTQAGWERALDNADAHVLQARVLAPRQPFPDATVGGTLVDRIVSVDPFLVQGEPCGFLCRLSPKPLANVSQGATQVPVFLDPG